jgi:hypothetical protein
MVTRKPGSANSELPGAQGNQVTTQGFITLTPYPEKDEPRDIRYIFVQPPKFLVGTTVSDAIYYRLLDYEGGISKFIEDALASFDGNLDALLTAAVQLAEDRKRSSKVAGIRTANGRVSKAAYSRIKEIEAALTNVRGISRAKVLSGLIKLFLI